MPITDTSLYSEYAAVVLSTVLTNEWLRTVRCLFCYCDHNCNHSTFLCKWYCSYNLTIEKKAQNIWTEYTILSVSDSCFRTFQKENLREEDNLSTRDKGPVPNVSFVQRFYCSSLQVLVECLSAGGNTDFDDEVGNE